MSKIKNRWFLCLMISGLLAVSAGCPATDEDGESDGHSDGHSDGDHDGHSDGDTDGHSDGDTDGHSTDAGNSDGTTDGTTDGTETDAGSSDGMSDGTMTDAGSSDGSTDGTETDAGVAPVAATMDYTYPSTYGGDCEGEDSVYYGGQTYRQVIISTIKQYLKTLNSDIDTSNATATAVRSALDLHIDADASIEANPIAIGTTGDFTDYVQTTLGDFAGAGSSPASKMAGKDNNCKDSDGNVVVDNIIAQAGKVCDSDNATAAGAVTAMIGWGDEASPTNLVDTWFQAVADAAEDRAVNGNAAYDPSVLEADRTDDDKLPVYVTAAGHDYQQLLQKFLLGAVTFSQGADDYLDQGLTASNAQSSGKCYSSLAHKWDEGYGYFGASRYYGQQTDAENKAGYQDQDVDDKLNLETEANYGHSVNAAKRDIGATVATDFTAGAFNAFKSGRDLIAAAGDTLTAEELTALEGHRDAAISNWEKAISATVVHYINDVLADMDDFGTADYSFTNHAKHWGELKGFAMSFQFNPYSPMYGTAEGETTTHFENFHTHVGTAPVLSTATAQEIADYKTALEDARTLLQTAYGFDAQNVANW